jgi:AraC-like DNA-binding protein
MSYKIFTIGEHLRMNLQNPPTKEMVCQRFAISDYYLRKEFKKVFGLNFGEYIRQQKIKTGAKLLLSSNLLVSTISECVGFSNHSKFALAFRKAYGICPHSFRNNIKKTNHRSL